MIDRVLIRYRYILLQATANMKFYTDFPKLSTLFVCHSVNTRFLFYFLLSNYIYILQNIGIFRRKKLDRTKKKWKTNSSSNTIYQLLLKNNFEFRNRTWAKYWLLQNIY